MKPMKPCTLEDKRYLRFPLLGSAKIDGYRCRINDGTALSNNWKPFPNVFVMEQLRGLPPLDGEIVVGKPSGPGVLQRTSSGVMSRDGEPDFRFFVFDSYLHPEGFEYRLNHAKRLVKELGHRRVIIVPHRLIRTEAEFDEFVRRKLLEEYEGAMFRDPQGPYKAGRATEREGYLWRVKPFVDSEMRVDGWFEQEANTNVKTTDVLGRAKRSSHKAGKVGKGVLGGFTGTDIHTGQPVRVGNGFSDAQRLAYWLMPFSRFKGRLLKYKKQMVGEKDKPRHTVFLDWRDASDL